MTRFPVRPEKQAELDERMRRLGIREDDLEEQYVRHTGMGGQKRNKTSNAVSLLHRPTGIRVKCCEDRSQSLNRFFARRRLVEKMENALLGQASPERRAEEKRRKQKDRRRRRSQRKEEA